MAIGFGSMARHQQNTKRTELFVHDEDTSDLSVKPVNVKEFIIANWLIKVVVVVVD